MSKTRFDLDALMLKVRQEWQFVMATFAASGVGYLGSAGAPVIVAGLIDAGLDTQQTGDLGTVELMMLAVTSTLVTPIVTRVSHRKLAIGGALVAAIGLLVSAGKPGFQGSWRRAKRRCPRRLPGVGSPETAGRRRAPR